MLKRRLNMKAARRFSENCSTKGSIYNYSEASEIHVNGSEVKFSELSQAS